MKIELEWLEKQKTDPDTGGKADPYVMGIVRVAEKVLDLMEELPDSEAVDAEALVHAADRALEEHITGNMAAYVAMIATRCHSRGEEFRASWNASHGKPESKGIVNPAVMTIG